MKYIILILLLVVRPFSLARGQSEWKLTAVKEGIKVYAKTVDESKIKALKAECLLDATSSEVVALLLDVKASERWVRHTKSCILIRQVSPTDLYYHTEVSLPWPLENRDFVTHLTVSEDRQTRVVTVSTPAISGWVPVKKGVVRIENGKSVWKITPVSKERVKLDYVLHVDPGGNIPAVVVNAFASQVPIETFTNMKKELRSGRYRN